MTAVQNPYGWSPYQTLRPTLPQQPVGVPDTSPPGATLPAGTQLPYPGGTELAPAVVTPNDAPPASAPTSGAATIPELVKADVHANGKTWLVNGALIGGTSLLFGLALRAGSVGSVLRQTARSAAGYGMFAGGVIAAGAVANRMAHIGPGSTDTTPYRAAGALAVGTAGAMLLRSRGAGGVAAGAVIGGIVGAVAAGPYARGVLHELNRTASATPGAPGPAALQR